MYPREEYDAAASECLKDGLSNPKTIERHHSIQGRLGSRGRDLAVQPEPDHQKQRNQSSAFQFEKVRSISFDKLLDYCIGRKVHVYCAQRNYTPAKNTY
jgi:hypothetical protein